MQKTQNGGRQNTFQEPRTIDGQSDWQKGYEKEAERMAEEKMGVMTSHCTYTYAPAWEDKNSQKNQIENAK